jgi:hypothetical protein
MATSPIYSWPEPDNTDLVKNGALAIRTLGNAIDTTMGTMVAKTIIDAKGDLIAASAADTPARLAVGANGETLVADSSTSTGLKWAKSPNFVGVGLYKASTQAIPTAVWTAVTFSTEDFDTDSFHDTSTNTSRITIPTGLSGKYLLTGVMSWQQNANNNRAIAIYKTGVATKQIGLIDPNGDFNTQLSFATIISANAGDYFELFTYQDTGGNLNAMSGSGETNLQAQFLGA